jgi:neutral ceramidase
LNLAPGIVRFVAVIPLRLLTSLLACVVIPASAASVASGVALQAGVARADITPDPAMLNWTTTPSRPYGEVHDPLFARALVLFDGNTRIAILQWDLLDAREFAVARVRGAVSHATGIPEGHIIISASHNHSGPKSEMSAQHNLRREEQTSRPAQAMPVYRAWADRLVDTCVDLVKKASAAAQPASLSIGRAYAGDWMFNRRPVKPDGTVVSMLSPPNPHVLGSGLKFGLVDPTLTVLGLRDRAGNNICTVFHLPMHAVAIYGASKAVSADWPGRVADLLREKMGGETMFLQGCAGDIVPARRGFEAVETMSPLLATRAAAAEKVAVKLPPSRIQIARARIGLPATPQAAEDYERPDIGAEVMAVSFGPLALVTLPGEPLQELATAIQQRSTFPHTIVLGYANGRGVGYVGLPGGKAKGGYEMTDVGAGTDEAGSALVETAVRLLRDVAIASAK